MVNAAAAGTPNIRKSRAGTLNLLAKFVMGKYEPNNASKEAMDNHNYWELFLEKNEHLIILNAGNGTDKKQANHPENLTIDDTITSLKRQASNNRSMHTVTTHLLLQENKQKIISIKLMEAGIAGGFISGLVNALLVIVFPPLLNGYHNLPANALITLIPRIAFSNITGGTGVGLLLAYFGNPDKAKNSLSGFSLGQIVFIAILLLSLLVVFKQSAARSAWTTRGILEGSDFETVAYFFSMLTGVLHIMKVIRKNNSMGFVQSLTSTLLIVLNDTIPLLNTRVTKVDATGVQIGSELIPARTSLWAAGLKASGLTAQLGAALDRAGRVKVNADLTLPDNERIHVLGDLIALEQDGKPLPGVAQTAIQSGELVAANILNTLEGKPRKAFRYKDKGSMATIGRARAIADVNGIRFAGFFAWMLWLFIHVLFLVDFRNRLAVLFKWAWPYLTWQRSCVFDALEPAAVATLAPGELARLGLEPGAALSIETRRQDHAHRPHRPADARRHGLRALLLRGSGGQHADQSGARPVRENSGVQVRGVQAGGGRPARLMPHAHA